MLLLQFIASLSFRYRLTSSGVFLGSGINLKTAPRV